MEIGARKFWAIIEAGAGLDFDDPPNSPAGDVAGKIAKQ
jgi:hypothetical protein